MVYDVDLLCLWRCGLRVVAPSPVTYVRKWIDGNRRRDEFFWWYKRVHTYNNDLWVASDNRAGVVKYPMRRP